MSLDILSNVCCSQNYCPIVPNETVKVSFDIVTCKRDNEWPQIVQNMYHD